MLTDKAKEDYNKWCADKGFDVIQFPETEYNDVFQNALIIEWLDSLGKWRDSFYETDNETLDGMNVTWNYTCMRAIEHANDKYNADAKEDTNR